MFKHIVSFVRCPIGYVLNFVATACCLLGPYEPLWLEGMLAKACQAICIPDGVQDDWHPLVPGSWAIKHR